MKNALVHHRVGRTVLKIVLAGMLLPCLLWNGPMAPRVRPASAAAGSLFVLDWSFKEYNDSYAVAWGDYDGDGDLDLAVGNIGSPSLLYRNDNGVLKSGPVWSSPPIPGTNPAKWDPTTSVAWGDIDNDGDLDLAVGNNGQPSHIYRNDKGVLTADPVWSSPPDKTTSIAWGDYNNDRYLDLAVGNSGEPARVYQNNKGTLASSDVWHSAQSYNTTSIAWGDYNQDGNLDLAVGNSKSPGILYKNNGANGNPAFTPDTAAWSSPLDDTWSIAWGDYDNDGWLDLAVGNYKEDIIVGGGGQLCKLYHNNNGVMNLSSWTPTEALRTKTIAWGDYNGDGYLDLALAGYQQPVWLYQNNKGALANSAVWSSDSRDETRSIAWGDYDGDGKPDLVAGVSVSGQGKLYKNNSSPVFDTAWSSHSWAMTTSVAWGDYNNDGYLDLAVGNSRYSTRDDSWNRNQVYENQKGSLASAPTWSSSNTIDFTYSIAWGDYNNDGYLDLATGNAKGPWNEPGPARLYQNNQGVLKTSAIWSSEGDYNGIVAWGDYNGDGYLDLAVVDGNTPARLYQNDHGVLTEVWSSDKDDHPACAAWGDVDGDGDLDLAVGYNGKPIGLYRNDNGVLTKSPWSSIEADSVTSIAWGDSDGDGDLDLAVATKGGRTRLYSNDNGVLSKSSAWSSIEAYYNTSVTWGDFDNDGDPDLAVGNNGGPVLLYRNDRGNLTGSAVWTSPGDSAYTSSVAWGDFDNDGDLDLAVGDTGNLNLGGTSHVYRNMLAEITLPGSLPKLHIYQPVSADKTGLSANGYADPYIWEGQFINIPYMLGTGVTGSKKLVASYSLDCGGSWQPAKGEWVAASSTSKASFKWDVYASGFFGKSDCVVVRIQGVPDLSINPGGIPGPFLYGSRAAQSLPFRARGIQVRVEDRPDHGVQNALVYRVKKDESQAGTMADLNGTSYRTDIQGYLQGSGVLQDEDQLAALWPASTGEGYTLYYTSAPVTKDGVTWQNVDLDNPRSWVLPVSSTNPLVLFDLKASLEWDASQDTTYQNQLAYDLQRTSASLYDWSNGRVALGKITLSQDHENWTTANIQINATNRLRPNAALGGIVGQETTEADTGRVFEPGQVHIGVVWNRFGDPSGKLGEDWPVALAHELSHYLLYMDDNYLGINQDGLVIPIGDCLSAMNDPYRDDYSEFLFAGQWNVKENAGCLQTLSQMTTGRADWDTIFAHYDGLKYPDTLTEADRINTGPNQLPFPVQVDWQAPTDKTQPVEAPIFLIKNGSQPGMQAFLFHGDRLTDLGQPVNGRVTAYGARTGDRVCVYGPSDTRFGCLPVGQGTEITGTETTFHPGFELRPVNSYQLVITATGIPAGQTATARLYLPDGTALMEQTLQIGNNTIESAKPITQGKVWIHVTGSPAWESILSYTLGGSPVNSWSRDVNSWSRDAPAASSDGGAVLYGNGLAFAEGEFFSLQSIARLGNLPTWATQVGPAYRILRSGGAPTLSCAAQSARGLQQPSASPAANLPYHQYLPFMSDCVPVSLAFYYRGEDVPGGEENLLQIYYLNGGTWQPLKTTRDTTQNLASAQTQGEGVYALMTTYEFQLATPDGGPGWAQFTYPIPAGQPIANALSSITGSYTVVYTRDVFDKSTPWKLYAPDAPTWVSDLTKMEFGRAYWIYLKHSVTLRMRGVSSAQSAQQAAVPVGIVPPAAYYGAVSAPAGSEVTAWVGNVLCGQSLVEQAAGQQQNVFVVKVTAEDPGAPNGCGSLGKAVTIKVGGVPFGRPPAWDYRVAQEVKPK